MNHHHQHPFLLFHLLIINLFLFLILLEEISSEELRTLCRLLLITVHKYNSRRSRLLINSVIDFACTCERIRKDFITEFIGCLGELASEYFPSGKPSTGSITLDNYYLYFFAANSLLVNHLDVCKELKKDQWLAASLIILLTAIEESSNTARRRVALCQRICEKFLLSLKKKDLWDLYTTAYEKKASLFSMTATGLLASACTLHNSDLKSKFIKVYESILLATATATPLALFAFTGFLKNLDDEDVKSMVATIKRAFARNPKAAADSGLLALRVMKLDINANLVDIVTFLQPALKQESESILKDTCNLIVQLFGRISDRTVAASALSILTKFSADRNLKIMCKQAVLDLLSKLTSYTENSKDVSSALVPVFKTSSKIYLYYIIDFKN